MPGHVSNTTSVPSTLPPVVLGGGMAGITAAIVLADLGLCPILIEARPYLGGRTRSFIHRATGDEIDNGQHLLMGCYRSTFRLLNRLGTNNLVTLQSSLHVEFREANGHRDVLTAPAFLPSPFDALAGMMRLQGLSVRQRLALLRIGLAAKFGTANKNETVTEYLIRHGQSHESRRRLWDPIIIATLNTPPAEASALLFVEVMRQAFLGTGDSSHLAMPHTGLSQLIAPATRAIEDQGGQVLTGRTLKHIEYVGNGVSSQKNYQKYRLTFADGEYLETGQIISALPLNPFRMLVGTMIGQEQLASTFPFLASDNPHSPIASLYLWFDSPLTTIPAITALIGTNTQWVFNRRAIAHTSNKQFPGLISCTISAAFQEAVTDADIVIAQVHRELKGVFPEIRSAVLLDSLLIKEKHATFTATPAFQKIRPRSRTKFPGFYLAGDWTDTKLHGN